MECGENVVKCGKNVVKLPHLLTPFLTAARSCLSHPESGRAGHRHNRISSIGPQPAVACMDGRSNIAKPHKTNRKLTILEEKEDVFGCEMLQKLVEP